MRDARDYVTLAEGANGPIPRTVSFDYSVTTSNRYWPEKGIHYRMSPENVGCLTAGRIDACALANIHMLDWGYKGLGETLRTLDAAGVARSGAGSNADEAMAPAILDVVGKGRVLPFHLET